MYKFSTASDAVEPTKRPRALSNKKVLTESGGATTSFFFLLECRVGWVYRVDDRYLIKAVK